MEWRNKQKNTFTQLIDKFNDKGIKYFILRNYEGLPDTNPAKDIDIIIEPGMLHMCEQLLWECFRTNEFTNLHKDDFEHGHCYRAIDMVNRQSIHIDLIEGYVSKGYEVFSFDELYEQMITYKNMRVLNPCFNGMMILLSKLFGYRKIKLKDSYKEAIKKSLEIDEIKFRSLLCQLVGEKLSGEMVAAIKENDFEHLISLAPLMTRNLRHYVRKKKPLSIIGHYAYFIQKKVSIIILFYKKYAKTVAVVAPDGAGKSTFLDALIDEMNYLLINTPEDGRFHVYHFRPGILPNLGAVGEKMKLKEQDKDFTNPHRAKPAGFISSLFRALWYWFDYVLGWQKCVRNDVHYGRYTLFDRYCYDYIVDPERMRISLPLCLRKLFVATIPKPGVIFFLDADEDVIYRRKKELTKDEISSQLASYRELAKKDSRFVVLDATKEPKALAMEAAGILIDKYTLNIK